MHTQIDLRGNIPSFIHVSDGKMHEVNILDLMTPEPGSFSSAWIAVSLILRACIA